MPRQGDGSSHNGPFDKFGREIAHGTGKPETDKVPRADKTADLPEGIDEHGAGAPGVNASGGRSQGIKIGDDVGQGGRGSKN
ncbi:hypothetical protein E4U42_000071 [Claviceps africana]|uniref:Uncharacterized protein n=1 Tax=Claviceps africana TaxID=83212 RepID=A0A8K0J0L6_9HYPO|nr:hypothetical protein E4U42_000071 [Claviceps africana]